MSIADKLDQLTHTFQKDRDFCENLFASRNVEVGAELLVSHQWANRAFVICQKLLCAHAPDRFGERRGEKSALWTFVLSESMHRDMRLVSYRALRGLFSVSATILRRALEDTGVLTHLWSDPTKLDSFEDPGRKQYVLAFRCEVDWRNNKALKKLGLSKRFAAMAAGKSATLLYKQLSEFHVHGGTPTQIRQLDLNLEPNACAFAFRIDANDEIIGEGLRFLRQGHQLLCCELVSLCLN